MTPEHHTLFGHQQQAANKESPSVDLLAFGAHPDDVEICLGGLLIKMKNRGYRTGIADLTRGEMGSRGTAQLRAQETAQASRLLAVDVRENLNLGDSRLTAGYDQILAAARLIRKLRPSIILAPYFEDWHPDHAAAGRIVQQAFFQARLAKLDLGYPPHYPRRIYYYPAHQPLIPTFVVDITAEFPRKMEALSAYRSQIFPSEEDSQPYRTIGVSDYAFHVESRCRYFGSLINVKYGEALWVDRPLRLDDPCSL
ncbi:MAG: bacillithiol biosynthesis deacetylase BshB1 [bacterium]|nr:bacillithiol biosynthesis deacetylase BshB1 [bacterium]